MMMAMCKVGRNSQRRQRLPLFKGSENNHLLSGEWAIDVVHPGNYAKAAASPLFTSRAPRPTVGTDRGASI